MPGALEIRVLVKAEAPGEDRIVVGGDSVTMGAGVWERQAYPALLEARLNERAEGIRYEVLNLGRGEGGHEEAKVRKAYFKLAQKYHPDKNPDGRVSKKNLSAVYG